MLASYKTQARTFGYRNRQCFGARAAQLDMPCVNNFHNSSNIAGLIVLGEYVRRDIKRQDALLEAQVICVRCMCAAFMHVTCMALQAYSLRCCGHSKEIQQLNR